MTAISYYVGIAVYCVDIAVYYVGIAVFYFRCRSLYTCPIFLSAFLVP